MLNKRGMVEIFLPLLWLITLLSFTYIFVTLSDYEPVTPQFLGDVQKEILNGVGDTEKDYFYNEQLVRQAAVETFYELGNNAGFGTECKRKEHRYYSKDCKPENVEEAFLLLLKPQLAKKGIKVQDYEIKLEKDNGYRLILLTDKTKKVFFKSEKQKNRNAFLDDLRGMEEKVIREGPAAGFITYELDISVPLEENFKDYEEVYNNVQCMVSKNCFDERFKWSIGEKDSSGFRFITVETKLKDPWREREPVTIKFYVDPKLAGQ